MTTKRKWIHAAIIVAGLVIGTLIESLTTGPWAHVGWGAAVLPLLKLLREVLAGVDVPPGPPAVVGLLFLVGLSSCAHFPPGVNAPMCALDVIDDVGSVLVCNLVDHASLPSCVIDGLRKIATDHNCDVTGIVQAVAGNAQRNAEASGDYLEAVKAQRARAWLKVQPPDPTALPPIHDKKK